MMDPTFTTIATLCKYTSDYLKLRKDKKSGDEAKTIRDYIEACRRRDHDQVLGRFDLLEEHLAGFQQLLTTLGELTDDQATVVLNAIEEGNFSLLSTLGASDISVHAKLDRILNTLDVQPRQLFATDYQSWQNQGIREFEARYLKRAHGEFGRLEMLGVPAARDLHQKLDVAYVNLELAALNRDETSADRWTGRQTDNRAEKVFTRTRRLTIRGPAGSGKTTLLRWIAFQCALAAETRDSSSAVVNKKRTTSDSSQPPSGIDAPAAPWKGGIPLFIPLRKLNAADRGKPDEKKLHEYAFDAGLFENAPNGWLQTVFSEGRAVLLIDGIDEIPSSSRKFFWDWLNKLIRDYSETRIFVTSRPLSAALEDDSPEWQPPANFNHAELRDLSRDDRSVFIRNWHDAVKAVQPDKQKQVQLDTSCQQLLRKLDDRAYSHVLELCKNPLTAGLICALYWRELKLPETRGELYQRSCDMLMVIRDEVRDIKSHEALMNAKKTDRFRLVQCLAWEMMQNVRADNGQNIEVPDQDAQAWLKIHLPGSESREFKRADSREVLKFLIERSGLLRVPSKGYIDFHHRSFQEYLAACAAADLNQPGNLVGKAGNDQWRDTIILAANTHVGGVPFGRQLIVALLEAGRKKGVSKWRECIALAAACLAEAVTPPIELRNEVERRLLELIPPGSPGEAEALAIGGEAILPYLAYEKLKAKDRRVNKVLLTCVKTIARIGTEKARQLLTDPNGYAQTDSLEVWMAACDCPGVDPLNAMVVLDYIAKNGRIPVELQKLVKRLDALEGLTQLRSLSLLCCSEVTDFRCLTTLTNLRILNLSSTGVTDMGLKYLTELTNLNTLELSSTGVTDVGLKYLTELTNLNTLELGSTGITDAGLKHLTALKKNLNRLDLRGTKVTDAGLKYLTELTNLNSLELSSTGVTDVGLKHLTALTNLRTINLTNTKVTTYGLDILGEECRKLRMVNDVDG